MQGELGKANREPELALDAGRTIARLDLADKVGELALPQQDIGQYR
jgi:hypothetical protein